MPTLDCAPAEGLLTAGRTRIASRRAARAAEAGGRGHGRIIVARREGSTDGSSCRGQQRRHASARARRRAVALLSEHARRREGHHGESKTTPHVDAAEAKVESQAEATESACQLDAFAERALRCVTLTTRVDAIGTAAVPVAQAGTISDRAHGRANLSRRYSARSDGGMTQTSRTRKPIACPAGR